MFFSTPQFSGCGGGTSPLGSTRSSISPSWSGSSTFRSSTTPRAWPPAWGSPSPPAGADLACVHGRTDRPAARGEGSSGNGGSRWGSGEVEVVSVDYLDAEGRPTAGVKSGEPLTLRVRYYAHQRDEHPVIG